MTVVIALVCLAPLALIAAALGKGLYRSWRSNRRLRRGRPHDGRRNDEHEFIGS